MAIKKSNHVISMMSLIGIILVVFGHSGFEEPIVMERLLYFHTWVYSFHMPLFFFISGYLFALTNNDFKCIKTDQFLYKKFKRLYIPYLILGLVIFAIKFSLSNISHADRTFSIQNFLMMFIAPHWQSSTMGYLWYIATLFFMFILVSLLIKLVDLRESRTAIIVMTLMWIGKCSSDNLLPLELSKLFNIGSLLWYTPFFVLGIQYQPIEHKVLVYCKDNAIIILLATNIILAIYAASVVFLGFDCLPVKILVAMVGILMVLTLSQLLLNSKWIDEYLLPIGDITYTIYLMSFFGQYAVKIVIVNLFHWHWSISVIAMFISGLIFPLMVNSIYKKSPLLQKVKLIRYCIGL